MAECYVDKGETTVPLYVYPLNFKLLQKEQQKDKAFVEALKKSKTKYDIKVFQRADKSRSIICWKGKIIVPLLPHKCIFDWYPTTLCHPGAKCTELTIHQHFEWKTCLMT
eukprot:6969460-Ditylum_brightwellii.AAC.2